MNRSQIPLKSQYSSYHTSPPSIITTPPKRHVYGCLDISKSIEKKDNMDEADEQQVGVASNFARKKY
jgi:hypothetical protein